MPDTCGYGEELLGQQKDEEEVGRGENFIPKCRRKREGRSRRVFLNQQGKKKVGRNEEVI